MGKHRAGTVRNPLPALNGWARFGGGMGRHDKRDYTYTTKAIKDGGKQYSIAAHTTAEGRHAGYLLSVFPGFGHGHAGIAADGHEVMVNSHLSDFRSPQAAVSAARKHATRVAADISQYGQ